MPSSDSNDDIRKANSELMQEIVKKGPRMHLKEKYITFFQSLVEGNFQCIVEECSENDDSSGMMMSAQNKNRILPVVRKTDFSSTARLERFEAWGMLYTYWSIAHPTTPLKNGKARNMNFRTLLSCIKKDRKEWSESNYSKRKKDGKACRDEIQPNNNEYDYHDTGNDSLSDDVNSSAVDEETVRNEYSSADEIMIKDTLESLQ